MWFNLRQHWIHWIFTAFWEFNLNFLTQIYIFTTNSFIELFEKKTDTMILKGFLSLFQTICEKHSCWIHPFYHIFMFVFMQGFFRFCWCLLELIVCLSHEIYIILCNCMYFILLLLNLNPASQYWFIVKSEILNDNFFKFILFFEIKIQIHQAFSTTI